MKALTSWSSTEVGLAGLGCAAAAAAGLAVTESSTYLLALLGVAVAITLVATIDPPKLAAGLLCYLPFEIVLASHVHGQGVTAVLVAGEAVSWLLALRLVLTRSLPRGRSAGLIGAGVAVLSAAWVLTAVWNGRSAYTALLGWRAELRYLPLILVGLYSLRVISDMRLVIRGVLLATGFETVLALFEIVGGHRVQQFVHSSYSATIGGVAVSSGTRQDVVAGTFRDYNELSAVVLFGWIFVMVMSAEELGIPSWLRNAMRLLMPVVIVFSGSREGAAALIIVGGLIVARRHRNIIIGGAAAIALIGAILLPYIVQTAPSRGAVAVGRGSGSTTSQLFDRWQLMLNANTYSAEAQQHDFRLYLGVAEADLVASHHPLVGFGLGSIMNKKLQVSGTSPLNDITAGQEAIATNRQYDGNWPLLMVETGFGGVLLIFIVMGIMAWTGVRATGRAEIGQILALELAGIFVLGFFAPVVQSHFVNATLWLTTGFVCAIASDRVRLSRPRSVAEELGRPMAAMP